MSGADLVLNDLADEGGAQFGRERECRVLVDRPECVVAPVCAGEPKPLRRAPAAAAAGGQPARESGQVEHLDLERRGPEIAIVGAEHEAVEPSGSVVRSRHHRDVAGGRRPHDRRLGGQGREYDRHGEPQPGASRRVQSSHSAKASTPRPERSTTVTLRRARPSRRNSTRMNPLARFAKRVLSSAVTRSRWPKMPAPLTSSYRALVPPITWSAW